MKLRKLAIKNFATYREAELNYDSLHYPLFIVGGTGSGKTTILVDALSAALFGKAYGERRESSVKYAKPTGLTSEVSLQFEVGDSIYLVKRRISDLGQKVLLYKVLNGKLILLASTVKSVNDKIREIIGFDLDDFLHTVVVRQGEVATIISKEFMPKQRTQLFQKIFKLDYSKMQERAREIRRKVENEFIRLEERLKEIKGEVEQEDELKSEVSSLKKELSKLEGEKSRVELEKEGVEREISLVEEELKYANALLNLLEADREHREYLEMLKSNVESYLNGVASLDLRIESIRREIMREDSLKAFIQRLRNEMEEISRELTSINRELALLEQSHSELRELIKTAENALRKSVLTDVMPSFISKLELRGEWVRAREEISEIESELKEVQGKIELLKLEMNSHLEAASKLSSGLAKCPVCFNPIKNPREHIQRHLNEVKRIDGQVNLLKRRVESLERRREEAIRKFIDKSKSKLIEKLKSIEESIKSRSSALSRKESELRSLKEKILQLEEELSELKLMKENLNSALRIRREIQVKPKKLPELVESIELAELLSRILDLRSRISSMKESLKRVCRRKAELNAKLSSFKVRMELTQVDLNEFIEGREEKLSKLKNALEEKYVELNKLSEKIAEIKARINERELRLKRISELKAEARELSQRLSELELDLKALSIVERRVFDAKGFPLSMLKKYLGEIEAYANEYLQRFLNHLSISISVDEKTSSVSIDVYDEYSNTRRELFTYSGGEQTLIGFAIRLAISRVLASEVSDRPRFLIIDEGFGPLSEEYRDSLIKLISELKKEYDQIIVTSHIQDIRDSGVFQQEIRVVKEDGVSKLIAS